MKQIRFTHNEENHSMRIETDDSGQEYFVGYAAAYNSRSSLILERGRLFYEVLMSGCFDRVLQSPNLDVMLTVNHQLIHNLGRTISKNLTLQSDNIGLRFRAKIPNTTLGKDTKEMIERGDYTDCSFSFSVDESGEKWEREDSGDILHTVSEVSGLYDVTICTLHGAYENTKIDVERASRMINQIEEEEKKKMEKEREEFESQQQKKKRIVIMNKLKP